MRDTLLVGIDVGSSTLCSTVATRASDGSLRYIGHGSTPSAGFRAGVVTDPNALTEAFVWALGEAVGLAGRPVHNVILSVSGAQLTAVDRHGACALELASPVTGDDVMRALAGGPAQGLHGKHVIQRVVRAIALDGQRLDDPTGRIGKRLEVETRDYAVSTSLLNALRDAAERAGAHVQALVPAAVAAAAATLRDIEREDGALLVDIGSMTSDIAYYRNGELRELASVPFGGQHITLDLAQLLDISEADAEDLQWQHGATDPFSVAVDGIEWGSRGIATLQRLAARGRVPAPAVQAIAGARLRIIAEQLGETLATLGVNPRLDAMRGVVLTGGAAKLTGIDAVLADALGVPVRRAGVLAAEGFPEIPDPAVSASIGLLRYCARRLAAGDDERVTPAVRRRNRVEPVAGADTPESTSRLGSERLSLPPRRQPAFGAKRESYYQASRGLGRWMFAWVREFIPARAGE